MTGLLLWQIVTLFVDYKASFLGVPVLGWCIFAVAGVYGYQLLYKRKLVSAIRGNILLAGFVVQGLVWCGLSFAGMATWFQLSKTFLVDLSYLPRQAYYLFFLPLIAVIPLCGDAEKCVAFLKKYGLQLAIAYGAISYMQAWSLRMGIVPIFVVGSLLLFGWKNRPLDWVVFFLLLLTPSPQDGASTVLLLKVMLLGIILFRSKRWLVKIAGFSLPLVLLVSFALPQIPQLWKRIPDVNTTWRLEYWADETSAVLDSYGIGIGFGTTYASKEFYEPQSIRTYNPKDQQWSVTPFSESWDYNKAQRPFVTASHNSFVSVTFRQGMIGLFFLTAYLWRLWRKKCTQENAAGIYLFCGALAIISLNVGFESTTYLASFILALSLCNSTHIQEKYKNSQEGK